MIIIDMEMPKNCNDCCISIFGCICGKSISDIKDVDTLHERLPDCPLHELPKGKWIVKDESYWRPHHSGDIQVNKVGLYCSECDKRLAKTQKHRSFCPNCGAIMEA